MKKIAITSILLLLTITSLFAVTHASTKELKLQAGYGEITECSIRTISSMGLTQYSGMPFDIFDPYVQYKFGTDNPSNGQRIIARWDLISNCNFSLEINATPLKHVSLESTPLYYKLAHHFELSYLTSTGTTDSIEGWYVFFPNETATDGSGQTRVYMEGSYLAGNPVFSEIVGDYWALQDTFIGAVNNDIYFGFTENTSKFLASAEAQNLPDGNYKANVTITLTII